MYLNSAQSFVDSTLLQVNGKWYIGQHSNIRHVDMTCFAGNVI